MIFHENRLLAYYTLFFLKIGKMLQKLSSAAVVIDALRVNMNLGFMRVQVANSLP